VAPRAALFGNPAHPYTKALLSAVPFPDPDQKLDLTALMEGKASEPAAWPHPFTVTDGGQGRLTEIAENHLVRIEGDGSQLQVAP